VIAVTLFVYMHLLIKCFNVLCVLVGKNVYNNEHVAIKLVSCLLCHIFNAFGVIITTIIIIIIVQELITCTWSKN